MNQQKRRDELYALLGRLPDRSRPMAAELVWEETREWYGLEKLELDLNGFETVPAYFVKPRMQRAPVPVILYHHAHGGRYHVGKEELLQGSSSLHTPPYAEELAKRGIASLCLDTWAFGERSTISESELFKKMLWHGQVLWGMMMYDSLRAVDYLASRPDVDAGRIGTLGLSMGSTLAWWTAALDPRIKVVVDICCLTDYHSLLEENGLDRHGLFYYVPDLLNHFSTAEINALIAPRPHLSMAGARDELTPLKGLYQIDSELSRTYDEMDAREAWKLLVFDVDHRETKDMRDAAMRFLHRYL